MTVLDQAPVLDDDDARRIAGIHWGLHTTSVRELGSHQDRNFLLTSPTQRVVLKVANAAVPDAALDAQNAAMLALGDLDVEVPQPVPSRSGALRVKVDLAGVGHSARMVSFVEGTPLTGVGYLSRGSARAVGTLAGRVSAALAGFTHPGALLPSQWDLRRSPGIVAQLRPALAPELAALVVALSAASQQALAPVADQLPQQVIHGDITDFNIVATSGPDARPVPRGVIDFGDLMLSWRAAEAAVTICAMLVKDRRAPLRIAADVLAGFLIAQPLDELEVDALWPMVAARASAGLASTAHQLTLEPDNRYLHENLAVDRAVLEMVAAVPLELGRLILRRAAGLPAPARPAPAPGAPVLANPTGTTTVDLSPTSPVLDEGAWAYPARIRAAVGSARSALDPETVAVLPYGQAHLHRADPNSLLEPATMPLGVTMLLPQGARVHAPWPGTVEAPDPSVTRVVGQAGWDLVLTGARALVASGRDVAPGDPVGMVEASRDPALPDHVLVQVVASGVQAPTYCQPSLLSAWEQLCPDPSDLVGTPPAPPPPDPRALLQRRHATLASVQKHYFADPPQIERGWRHHLMGVDGRIHLDAINNVAVLGHSHPDVAAAVSRAMRTLNTNSRFHYAAQVELAERLAATMPAGLDRVFLVSTGSESVDLALRLARVHTGARDTIALRTAYHGWTTASDEVSSALMDNPRALETRPDWIHLAEPPNLYRGPFRGSDAGARYAQDVTRILADLATAGRRPAAFICETLNGNAGGIELPEDYLSRVYRDVRAAGGLVIADEVQVGYGRLGSHFWGFEMSDVVPDIVCLAKSTGNGFPVAAVVCTEQVADSFSAEGSFFASMGGTPAGAQAAIATLQALADEDLMGNAARMGARLRAGLQRLVDRHPMAGAVHGRGLYLGLELVTDHESRAPAPEATDALCERLLELGVVMAATGDHMNVLKIKPPLCIDEAAVDFLLEALEVAFTEGW